MLRLLSPPFRPTLRCAMQPSRLRGYHNGMLKNILLTAMLALWLPHAVQAQSDLPDLGEVSDATLSLADEARIGREVMRAMRESGQMLDDVEVSAYLNELGGRLAAFAQLPGGHFSYFAVNDNSINAFAMPGGYIGVHSGLILATQSEGELASVLAHETAHEAQRHIARMQAASNATSPWLLVRHGGGGDSGFARRWRSGRHGSTVGLAWGCPFPIS
ncbi:M48 family metalloprotease [Paludibacterium denitrificans]|uniref:M48 family metalloprotease n=1 Tax=Paludibacterium denitrificans TaxID=2675226 RepID=UPI001E2869A4|nr:M48 family metalloprotease [Paludibacterium denitrificans]